MIIKKHNLILWQLISLCTVAIAFAFLKGWLSFKSAALGGSAWIIPNLYFMQKLHQVKTIFNTQKMLKYFFLNVAIKLLLSFGIIALILVICAIDIIGFLSGYIAMILVSPLIPLWCGIKNA